MAGDNPKASTDGQKEFDAFVYHISHDVRAAVRALAVVPDWIEEDLIAELGAVPGSVGDHLNILKVQSRRVDQMMKDLLVYSQAGRGTDMSRVNLDQAVDEALRAHPLPLGFSLTRKLELEVVEFSPTDLGVLLQALLSNAIKHTHATGTQIEIGAREDGPEVMLWIKDDGPGIPSKHHARIFDMMTTLKSRDAVEGSGLGLAIVQKIITQRGGTVSVSSDPNAGGAEFVLRFPAVPAV